MFDLITIGDVTIDTFIKIHDAQVSCDLDKRNCKLCVNYGDKIPVDKLIHMVAGNAANSAVSASRLGLKTAIYANIGDDSSGEDIKKVLKKEGVDERYLMQNTGMESNFSAVIGFKGERTIFVYHQAWKYKLPDLENTRWVYFTSLSDSFTDSNIVNETIRFVQRTGAKLLYNPGTLQIKLGVRKSAQLLSLTDIFIVNKQEAQIILNKKQEINVRKLLKGLSDLGSGKVIITDGDKGSFSYDGKEYLKLEIFPAKKVEMTGAGDGYATGVLAACFYGKQLEEAMRWGAANSASVIGEIGPQKGLLDFEKIQQVLKENPEIKAKIF